MPFVPYVRYDKGWEGAKEEEMDSEDLQALEESISDWEKKARGETVKDRCPLCILGEKRESGNNRCNRCIIKKRTGRAECHGTPVWNNDTGLSYKRDMVKFLKSFLPKPKPDREEIKMREVIVTKPIEGTNIGDVSTYKTYGYKCGKDVRLLRHIDNEYQWITMNSATSNNYFSKITYPRNLALKDIIKCTCRSYTVYEFDNIDEFYKWALGEK